MSTLRMIVQKGRPNRFYGTSGHKEVQKYLEETLRQYTDDDAISLSISPFKLDQKVGKKLYQDDFDKKIRPNFKEQDPQYKKWYLFKNYMQKMIERKSLVQGKNYIWRKKGTIDQTLLLMAHYDTVSHNAKTLKIDESQVMPGADYNASSVSVLLLLIERLKDLPLDIGIDIAFVDAQSLGFLGAYELAKEYKGKNLVAVLNLEMLGHDSKVFDKKKKAYNFKAYARDKKMDEAFFETFNKMAKKSQTPLRFTLLKNSFNNSDHFRFWDLGVPVLTFSQDWENDFNKKYQSPNDFPETINQKSLYEAYKYLSFGVIRMCLSKK